MNKINPLGYQGSISILFCFPLEGIDIPNKIKIALRNLKNDYSFLSSNARRHQNFWCPFSRRQ
jgi:hypothetical protein